MRHLLPVQGYKILELWDIANSWQIIKVMKMNFWMPTTNRYKQLFRYTTENFSNAMKTGRLPIQRLRPFATRLTDASASYLPVWRSLTWSKDQGFPIQRFFNTSKTVQGNNSQGVLLNYFFTDFSPLFIPTLQGRSRAAPFLGWPYWNNPAGFWQRWNHQSDWCAWKASSLKKNVANDCDVDPILGYGTKMVWNHQAVSFSIVLFNRNSPAIGSSARIHGKCFRSPLW